MAFCWGLLRAVGQVEKPLEDEIRPLGAVFGLGMGVVKEVHEELVALFRPVFRRQQLRPQPDRADTVWGRMLVEAVEVDFGVGKIAVLDRGGDDKPPR